MSQPTPTPTPNRLHPGGTVLNPEISDPKKLPLIVDIAIDNNGKQMYQVHEYSKLVRKEMPRSTTFSRTGHPSAAPAPPPYHHDETTPTRRVLGTLLPSTLNQKKLVDDDDEYPEPELATRKHPPVGLNTPTQPHYHPVASSLLDHPDSAKVPLNLNVFTTEALSGPSSATSTISTLSFSRAQENDIWSEPVEQAFEEVLNIIPKNGLNKIKISGRSCGRNELISDYIFMKTGKFRTRKQVSLHIQVIKNLGHKLDIIKLINDGPTFDSEDAHNKNMMRFEEIFLTINLHKSMGINDSLGMAAAPPSASASAKRKDSVTSASSSVSHKRARRKSSRGLRRPVLPPPRFENFFMSVYDSYAANPVILSIQNNQDTPKALKIKENANIEARFPGLNDFQDCAHIPIIHNMVRILFPELPSNHSIELGFKSNILLNTSNHPIAEPIKTEPSEGLSNPASPNEYEASVYSSFTCIYSYGKEVLKFNESGIKLNENREFLVKFWKFFLSKLVGKDDHEINMAFKGMTIKQVVYDSSSPAGENDVPNDTVNNNDIMVSKLRIRLVLLWEFAKVDDLKDAITTTSNLILPSARIVTKSENIVPQVVEYPQSHGYGDGSAVAGSPASATNPGFPNYPAPLSSTAPSAMSMAQPMTSTTISSQAPESSSMEQPWEKPQIDVQRKFQSLQQMQLMQHGTPQQAPSLGVPYPHQQYQYLTTPVQANNPNQQYHMAPQPQQSMDFMMIPGDSQDYQTLLYPGGFINDYM
ncbi:TEA-domain-containing protein [Suhomyces tanzawaensis NRRL Y-17324]|uniref:TEA-domain-containing protein n=1 Tax=Suhomyces tanzawaensis NRRL Y-17324 TaxID=984487 RepID=A0A1E4SGC6_9ASCO|nr:TEA-domain-containing protein [Suhomyces tanzawaensis NRRL Y-17324]ODV78563.1 TEA-domain-containing protein [Suhomyces tanzawaensis NRRL Y-17324]